MEQLDDNYIHKIDKIQDFLYVCDHSTVELLVYQLLNQFQ